MFCGRRPITGPPLNWSSNYLILTISGAQIFLTKIPSAILTTNDELFIAVQGRFYWLYEFLEGTFVERFNKSRLAQLARMIATYHLLIEKSHLNNGKAHSDLFNRTPVLKEIGDYQAEILDTNRANRDDVTFVKESKILEPILRSLDESPCSNLRRYPIHGDINPQNLIWKMACWLDCLT